MQDEFAARFALDRFIWSGKAAAPARRSYLRSHLFGCVAIFGMAALVANGDSAPVAVWLFAGVTVLAHRGDAARVPALSWQLTAKSDARRRDQRRASRLHSSRASRDERKSLTTDLTRRLLFRGQPLRRLEMLA